MNCPKCGKEAQLLSLTNPRRAVWACPDYPACNCYVGCHPGTIHPLGVMADAETRLVRMKTHDIMGRLWKEGNMLRWHVYAEAAKMLGVLTVHVGECDIATCKKIQEWANVRARKAGVSGRLTRTNLSGRKQ